MDVHLRGILLLRLESIVLNTSSRWLVRRVTGIGLGEGWSKHRGIPASAADAHLGERLGDLRRSSSRLLRPPYGSS